MSCLNNKTNMYLYQFVSIRGNTLFFNTEDFLRCNTINSYIDDFYIIFGGLFIGMSYLLGSYLIGLIG